MAKALNKKRANCKKMTFSVLLKDWLKELGFPKEIERIIQKEDILSFPCLRSSLID